MTVLVRGCFVLGFLLFLVPTFGAEDASQLLTLDSPDGLLRMTFQIDKNNRPAFEVMRREVLLVSGTLCLKFADDTGVLGEGVRISCTQR